MLDERVRPSLHFPSIRETCIVRERWGWGSPITADRLIAPARRGALGPLQREHVLLAAPPDADLGKVEGWGS